MVRVMGFRVLLVMAAAGVLSGCGGYEPEADVIGAECWEMPMGVSSASAVVWGDTLFVLFGREGESAEYPSGRGYAVPLSAPSEVRVFSLPVGGRVKAAGVLVGDVYYFGLGFRGRPYHEGANLRDWWRLDLRTRELMRLADHPGSDTDCALAWCCGDSVFVSLGFASSFSKSTYRYDIGADEWELVERNSIDEIRAAAVGGMVGGRMFAGSGRMTRNYNDWYEFNHLTYRWEKRRRMPTRGRLFAAAACSERAVYVLGGRFFGGTETSEYFYRGVLEYDVARDSWRCVGNMEEAAEHQIAFWYDGCLYWGLGQDGDGSMIRKLYRYRP